MSVSTLKRFPPFENILKWGARAQGWWFDRTRGVTTSGAVALDELTLVGLPTDGFEYLPARPPPVRRALRALPIRDYTAYTFIDLGSGKGRVLFIAAEYPFRRVLGIEFAMELHRVAQCNARSYKGPGRKCERIESIHTNAKDFQFPDDNLVVFLFNPFPGTVVQQVLRNLCASLMQCPREAFIILLFPEFAPLLDATEWLHLQAETRRYRIYRAIKSR